MKEFDPLKYKEMVREHQARDDPFGWFDSIYSDAEGDHNAVFWADLAPSPYLLEWLENNPVGGLKKKAIAIGCGVGMMQKPWQPLGMKSPLLTLHPLPLHCVRTVTPIQKSTT